MQINIVNHTENPVIKLLARPMQINDVKVIKLLASLMHIASQHLRCIAAEPRPTEICLRISKIDPHLGKIDPHFHSSKIDLHFEIIDPCPKRNESLSGLAYPQHYKGSDFIRVGNKHTKTRYLQQYILDILYFYRFYLE